MPYTTELIFKGATKARIMIKDSGTPALHAFFTVYQGTDDTGTEVSTGETDWEGHANIYDLEPDTDYFVLPTTAGAVGVAFKTEKDVARTATYSQWEKLIEEIQSAEVRDLSIIPDNHPENSPIRLAFWTLPPGLYVYKEPVGTRIVRFNDDYLDDVSFSYNSGSLLVMCAPDGSVSGIYFPSPSSGSTIAPSFACTKQDGTSIQRLTSLLLGTDIYGRYPKTSKTVVIGDGVSYNFAGITAVGGNAKAEGEEQTALGNAARVNSAAKGSVALGAKSQATRPGEVYVGSTDTNLGYNGTNYRLIGGVHDGIALTDAATVAQGNILVPGAPDQSNPGVLGQLRTDTTNMHTYQCTAIDTTDPNNPVYTWTQRW